MNIKVIHEQVFGDKITVIYGGTLDEVNGFLKKKKSLDVVDRFTYGQICRDKDNKYRILFIKNVSDIPAIAHEVFHLVLRLCDFHGVPIRAEDGDAEDYTDETAAYLIEFYMLNILKYAK